MSFFAARRGKGVLVLFAALAAFALAACDSNDDGGSQESEVIMAVTTLSNAGLHDIDDSINEDGEIPPNARTVALRLQAVTLLTDWPSDLDDEAEALARTFGEMAAALDSDDPDMEAAGQVAERAHNDEHAFSAKVWAWLLDEAGIDSQGGDDHSN